MLEFSLKNGALFKSTFASFANEVVDCVLTFDEHGMTAQTMDSSHVSMVMINFVASEMFDNYKCTEPTSVGISVKSVLAVLKLSDKNSVVRIMQTTPGDSKLTIGITSKDNKINFLFDLNLMEIDTEELFVPENLTGWRFNVDFSDMNTVTKNMCDFGDSISLCFGSSTNGALLYQIDGPAGVVTGSLITQAPVWTNAENSPAENVTMKLSMRYLKNYLSCRDVSNTIELMMGIDIPLCVTYRVAENSSIVFYIAPKAEE